MRRRDTFRLTREQAIKVASAYLTGKRGEGREALQRIGMEAGFDANTIHIVPGKPDTFTAEVIDSE